VIVAIARVACFLLQPAAAAQQIFSPAQILLLGAKSGGNRQQIWLNLDKSSQSYCKAAKSRKIWPKVRISLDKLFLAAF